MGMVGDATSGVIFGGYSGNYLNDFYTYAVSGDTVTLTALTSAGASISARGAMGMVGDVASGIIFGGIDNNGGYHNDLYSYSVSGGAVTLTNHTIAGDTIGIRYAMGMVGDVASGIIFGGQNSSTRHLNDFYSFDTSAPPVVTPPPPVMLRTLCLTQVQYDAISAKDPDTIYLITG